MSGETFLLFESAAGLLLLRLKEWDAIAQDSEAVTEACADASRFKRLVEAVAFHAFVDAEQALETLMGIASGTVPPCLVKFLALHVSNELKSSKKKQSANVHAIGVCDAALGKALSDLGYSILFSPNILEVHRGVRMHLRKISKVVKALPLEKFQVGLGHAYSRELMQVDPRKQDKPIMQSIALIDSLEKNINTFAMKLKEWYGWHFPELIKIVPDTETFCKALLAIKRKDLYLEEERDEAELLEALSGAEEVRDEIMHAMKHSMGQDISDADFVNIERFAEQVLRLCQQRRGLQDYLSSKMEFVSPNLKAVVGEVLAARLISHAGALVNLAKYPASTIQILGAEKALFRALKAKSGRTPKYGLLFHSTFIGRVQNQNHRGRMSRYLASKCAIAARIDAFSEDMVLKEDSTEPVRSNLYGEKLRAQLEERLTYLSEGVVPRKNVEVMREAMEEVRVQSAACARSTRKSKKSKKLAAEETEEEVVSKKSKKHKLVTQETTNGVESLVVEKKHKKKKVALEA